MRIDEDAPAKVNLTLHVTGRRADGYHLLDSLVAFADIGDKISVAPAERTRLTVTGPRAAGVPTDASNLVLKAAALVPQATAEITLNKHLPAASGIGGGSADAAATLRALSRLYDLPIPEDDAILALGADVPVCLLGRASRMSGIGDSLSALPSLTPLPAVLVNPGVEVSTPEVFRALECRENPAMPAIPENLEGPGALAEWLASQRNDLEPPAVRLAPVIGDILGRLRNDAACLLARMSGSGATCFGLFASPDEAKRAAQTLGAERPDWWVAPTLLR